MNLNKSAADKKVQSMIAKLPPIEKSQPLPGQFQTQNCPISDWAIAHIDNNPDIVWTNVERGLL